VWGQLARSRRLVELERERVATPDDDDLILDHLASEGVAEGPRLLVLHGLEGSSHSVYVQGMLALARERGWRATALNFRSCARDPHDTLTWLPNRRPRLYHSGETTDLDLVANELRRREPDTPLFAAGVSLGGNVLLKWLGEHPGQRVVDAAVAISVPFDLAVGARHLASPIGRFYLRHFLPTLRAKIESICARFPEVRDRIDLERALRARDFHPFDDAATAPLHGFAGADDYYTRSSSIGYLDRITTPTLCLSAIDDPFLPPRVLEQVRDAASPALELHFTPRGGHVGFVGGRAPHRASYWAERRALDWLASRAAASSEIARRDPRLESSRSPRIAPSSGRIEGLLASPVCPSSSRPGRSTARDDRGDC
jgi:predicted alpha/beta-fold hydrolase